MGDRLLIRPAHRMRAVQPHHTGAARARAETDRQPAGQAGRQACRSNKLDRRDRQTDGAERQAGSQAGRHPWHAFAWFGFCKKQGNVGRGGFFRGFRNCTPKPLRKSQNPPEQPRAAKTPEIRPPGTSKAARVRQSTNSITSEPSGAVSEIGFGGPVSYTHLTLPTKRIV